MSATVAWSDYHDWHADHMTAGEAVETSPHRAEFMRGLDKFTAKANRHEQVNVLWWTAPYVYVEVRDGRKDYPENMRALVSFDLTNGEWASDDSKRRYVFARRGWLAFMQRLVRHHYVPLYSEGGAR